MQGTSAAQAVRLIVASVALRVALLLLGLGPDLLYRVEVSTPANSLLSIREGVALLRMHISPYSGSACHVPPLLLWMLSPTALEVHLYALPNILADVLGAVMLRYIAQQLMGPIKGAGVLHTRTSTHTHTLTHTTQAYTHIHTHTRTHTYAHIRTHADTHIQRIFMQAHILTDAKHTPD